MNSVRANEAEASVEKAGRFSNVAEAAALMPARWIYPVYTLVWRVRGYGKQKAGLSRCETPRAPHPIPHITEGVSGKAAEAR